MNNIREMWDDTYTQVSSLERGDVFYDTWDYFILVNKGDQTHDARAVKIKDGTELYLNKTALVRRITDLRITREK